MTALAIMVALAAAVPMAAPPTSNGLVVPKEGFQDHVLRIGQDGTSEELPGAGGGFAEFVAGQLPESDRAKWYLTVYVDQQDPESRLLLRDMQGHAALKNLAAWCKYQVIDRGVSPSGEARHAAQELQQQQPDVPLVLLYANPNHPVFGRDGPGGWTYAFKAAGYGGDADLLARNLYQAVRSHYRKHNVTEQCLGPYCPTPDKRKPYRPATPDDWRIDPLPRLDAEPGGGLLPAIFWKLLLVGIGAIVFCIGAAVLGIVAIVLCVAWCKRRLDGPKKGGPAAMILLAALLGLAACPALAAVEEHNPPAPPVEFLIAPPAPQEAPVAPEECERFFPLGRIVEMLREIITVVVVTAFGLIGLSAANLLVGLRLLWIVRRPCPSCSSFTPSPRHPLTRSPSA